MPPFSSLALITRTDEAEVTAIMLSLGAARADLTLHHRDVAGAPLTTMVCGESVMCCALNPTPPGIGRTSERNGCVAANGFGGTSPSMIPVHVLSLPH